jgi:ribosome-associated protein
VGRHTISADRLAVEAAKVAASAVADKKGTAIALLDVSRLIVLTDIFVLGTGTSNRHVKTLVDEVEGQLRTVLGRKPLRREGVEHARWVLLDYGDVVVHLFDAETRDYYDLERLWADAPRIAFEPVAVEA